MWIRGYLSFIVAEFFVGGNGVFFQAGCSLERMKIDLGEIAADCVNCRESERGEL
jgi:hypothetical protein